MCGIFFILSNVGRVSTYPLELYKKIEILLNNRGPDDQSNYEESFLNWNIFCCGCTLWLQGNKPCVQPYVDDDGNILLWNGDVFGGPLKPLPPYSDTERVSRSLNHCSSEDEIFEILSLVEGPASFIYVSKLWKKVWFGRDCLGRHSLLWQTLGSDCLMLSSVGKREMEFQEVPAVGVYTIDLTKSVIEGLQLNPWSHISEKALTDSLMNSVLRISVSNVSVPSKIDIHSSVKYSELPGNYDILFKDICRHSDGIMNSLLELSDMQFNVNKLLDLLTKSVKVRCESIPSVCRDCSLIYSRQVVSYPALTTIGDSCTKNCLHTKVGILFSGGLDSAILAALAHSILAETESIDLINVAFQRKKSIHLKCTRSKNQQDKEVMEELDYEVAPDRITGTSTYQELKRIYPVRQWNFIKVNVNSEELDEFRCEKISDLIYPRNTVLDDSLGCALWFAARGKGFIDTINGKKQMCSTAKVLLLGMGADELFGGYRRHRTILKQLGWHSLHEELLHDIEIISVRNLGRDDRIISDHGRQGRFPYLDEQFVNFVFSLAPWERCFPVPEFPPGIGDKLLLRLAAWKLGLHKLAYYPKRAFQFGSRIANSREKGSDISERLSSHLHNLKAN